MKAKKIYLVHIGSDTFLMLNGKEKLTNKMCNSNIFENKEDANKDINVFEHFGVTVTILNHGDYLDRRGLRFKQLSKTYPYFSAEYLPEIKKRSAYKGLSQVKATFSY